MKKVICNFKPSAQGNFQVSNSHDLMAFLMENRINFNVSAEENPVTINLVHAQVEAYYNNSTRPLYIIRSFTKGDIEALNIASKHKLWNEVFDLLDNGASPEEALKEYDLI